MKYILLVLLSVLVPLSGAAQKGFPGYYAYVAELQRAGSLYEGGDYRGAARAYEASLRIPVERGLVVATDDILYAAACAWAQAGAKNEAFRCLDLLAGERRFAGYERTVTEPELASLQRDKRWHPLLDRLKHNAEQAAQRAAVYAERTQITPDIPDPRFYPLTGYARQFLDNEELPLLSVNHGFARIYFRGGSYTAQHLDTVREELTKSYYRILALLGVPAYTRGVHFVFVDSAAEMEELNGFHVRGGLACPGHDLVFFVYNGDGRRGQFTHELFHLMANEVWGITHSRLLNEGSAVYADNTCFYDNPINGINAYMLREGHAVPLQTLISDFDRLAAENELVAYLQSAGIFKYLYERYGLDRLRKLWTAGFDAFGEIYGFPVSELERAWKEYLETVEPPAAIDWQMLLEHGCG